MSNWSLWSSLRKKKKKHKSLPNHLSCHNSPPSSEITTPTPLTFIFLEISLWIYMYESIHNKMQRLFCFLGCIDCKGEKTPNWFKLKIMGKRETLSALVSEKSIIGWFQSSWMKDSNSRMSPGGETLLHLCILLLAS